MVSLFFIGYRPYDYGDQSYDYRFLILHWHMMLDNMDTAFHTFISKFILIKYYSYFLFILCTGCWKWYAISK